MNNKWVWWSVPSETWLYKRNCNYWFLYTQCYSRRYYYCNTVESCLVNQASPVSVRINTSPIDTLSDFEDAAGWDNLADGFDTALEDPTILLNQWFIRDIINFRNLLCSQYIIIQMFDCVILIIILVIILIIMSIKIMVTTFGIIIDIS